MSKQTTAAHRGHHRDNILTASRHSRRKQHRTKYGYDSLGQVTNACKYWANGHPVAGQQFDYTFDTIGNRTQTQAGGDTNGLNLRLANYYPNNLNQITNRDVPPYVDVIGASILTNVVTVNGHTAYRNQEYFRQQLAANNTNSALWTNIIVSGGLNVTGNVYLAQEPETFQYDADGNLTNDGRWAYVWDAENRLIQMTVNTNVGPQYKLNFAYDPKGRRIQKVVSTNSVGIYTNNFLYDGWNLVATISPSSSLINSFMWGSDLSGSMQGAGGVGGLLEMSYYGTSTTNCFLAYDGNGNVTGLINAGDGTLPANYEYEPFGELIRATGPLAKLNPIRFSTKYQDDESDLVCYPHRSYNTSIGRWLSRDPISEIGFESVAFNRRPVGASSIEQLLQKFSQKGLRIKRSDLSALEDALSKESKDDPSTETAELNPNGFVQNDPVNKFDPLGLIEYAPATCTKTRRVKPYSRGLCEYQCTCPRGYSLGFDPYVRIAPCNQTPEPTCFRLDCWDYVKVTACTVVVVGVIILSDGTAIPIYACAAAAP